MAKHKKKDRYIINNGKHTHIDKKYSLFIAFFDELDGTNSLFEIFVEAYGLEDYESSLYWAYDTCSFKKSEGMIVDVTSEFNIY